MAAPDNQSKILQLISIKGPVIPSNINKELNLNILFTSAMLSELVDNKILKLSNLKFGGSPLYFKPGQEHLLQNFSNKLNAKDRDTFDLLKSKKILQDSTQTPLVRVSLREIKDFAIPLEVSHNNSTEIFWKWYLLSNDESSVFIKKLLGIEDKSAPEVEKVDEVPKADVPENNQVQSQNTQVQKENSNSIAAEHIQPTQKPITQTHPAQPTPVESPRPNAQPNVEPEVLTQKSQVPSTTSDSEVPSKAQLNDHQTILELEQSLLKHRNDLINQQKSIISDLRKEISQIKEISRDKPKPKKSKLESISNETQKTFEKPLPQIPDDEFGSQISSFLKSNDIKLIDIKIIRKNSELDLVLDVPSPVGVISFYCKAKSKKTINDGDLSSAFVQGQLKKLPVLFVTSGKLTKRAEEMLSNEFKGMVINNI
ncbi:hypothetical protein HN587_05935 [Candidatus Woesearchaeota archaeon]|mgnify:CR=1 FL=1|jgi:hypothetical protein|nr:hypothetical protein [Candidatus Woesearchaeota archaeon]